MYPINLKKRKRVAGDGELVQVLTKQQRAEHQVPDCSSASTSSKSSHHCPEKTTTVLTANKNLDSNLNLNSQSKDVTSNSVSETNSKRNEDVLKMALIRVNELQEELLSLSDDDDDENDWSSETPEFIGFSVCLRETLSFLAAQGLDEDDPMVVNLKNSLMEAMPL